jgi:hypothetical protein
MPSSRQETLIDAITTVPTTMTTARIGHVAVLTNMMVINATSKVTVKNQRTFGDTGTRDEPMPAGVPRRPRATAAARSRARGAACSAPRWRR